MRHSRGAIRVCWDIRLQLSCRFQGTVMNRSPQAPENTTTAPLSTEHGRLIELQERSPDCDRRWTNSTKFGLGEAALDHPRSEDRTSHHEEHVVLPERVRDLRRSVDGGVERLQDRERADLYDCLSNWLVHALSEQTPPTTIKAEFSGRGFVPTRDVLSSPSGGPTRTVLGDRPA